MHKRSNDEGGVRDGPIVCVPTRRWAARVRPFTDGPLEHARWQCSSGRLRRTFDKDDLFGLQIQSGLKVVVMPGFEPGPVDLTLCPLVYSHSNSTVTGIVPKQMKIICRTDNFISNFQSEM